jgi:O-antigen ligase
MNKFAQSLPVIAALIFLAFPLALGLANTLLAFLLIAWILGRRYREHWEAIRSNPVMLAALALYGVVLIGALYSSAPSKDILLHLNKYSKLLIAVLIFCALNNDLWQRRAMGAFAGAMLFILVSTWLNIWFLLPWSASQTLGWGQSHHVFGDYITQNVMMSFFVLLCLVYAQAEASLPRRSLWLLVALLAAVSITHLSQGRTGYLLLAAALSIYVLSALKGKQRLAAVTAGVFFLGAAISSSELIEQRFKQTIADIEQRDVNNDSSIGHRLYNYQTTVELIQDHPLVGMGTGAYHTGICDYVENPEDCKQFSWHPHNQFLFFGAGHGLLGIIAYLLLIFSMVWLALRDENASSRTLLLGFAALLLIDSLFNSPLWSARESHFFAFMMALLAAQSSLSRRDGVRLR